MRGALPVLVLLLLAPGALAAQGDSAFVAWARTRAHAFPGPEAFAAVAPGVDRARLIGVGESVHEIEEFLTLRLDLLRELVARHRVTAVALESGLPEGLALDDYVAGRTDTVDFRTALGYGFGNFAVVQRTFRWLRDWNLGEGRGHPVRVVGVDLPASAGSMVPALDKILDLEPATSPLRPLIAAIRPIAVRVSGPFWRPAAARYDSLRPASRDSLRQGTARLVREAGAAAASSARGDLVLRLALVAEQTEAMLRMGAYHPDNPRDRAMAANTQWVLSHLGAGERALLWAHNAHVQRVPIAGPPAPNGPAVSMGTLLGRDLGDRYLAIGTTYGGPSVDSAAAPVAGGVDAALSQIGTAPFVMTLRPSPKTGPVAAWLEAERPIRFQVGHLLVPLGRAFDALAYFDRATPAARASP